MASSAKESVLKTYILIPVEQAVFMILRLYMLMYTDIPTYMCGTTRRKEAMNLKDSKVRYMGRVEEGKEMEKKNLRSEQTTQTRANWLRVYITKAYIHSLLCVVLKSAVMPCGNGI